MKHVGEWKHTTIHSYLSALDGAEWSASRSATFACMKCTPLPNGGRVTLRANMDRLDKRSISAQWHEWKNDSSIIQPVALSTLVWHSLNIGCFKENYSSITGSEGSLRMYARVSLCFVAMCRQIPCSGSILLARCPTKFVNDSYFINIFLIAIYPRA